MKINLTQAIKDVDGSNMGTMKNYVIVTEDMKPVLQDGQQLIMSRVELQHTMTLKKALMEVLFHDLKDENPDAKRKVEKFELGMKILKKTKEIDLSSNEKDLIKSLSGKSHATFIYGQICELIEGRTVDMEEEKEEVNNEKEIDKKEVKKIVKNR